MPLDNLAGKLVVPTRQQLHDKFLTWILVRNPAEDTRPGGQPDLDANVWADVGTMILSQAITIAGGVSRSTSSGSQVDTWLSLFGTQRLGAVGAGGSVAVSASSAGAQILAGDVLTYLQTGFKYEVTVGGTYANGQPVPISGIDTGPQTDLPAGSVLTFLTSRPGVTSLNATVLPQADGSGLSGGAGPEDDPDAIARMQYLASNPPASGNDAEYQSAITAIPSVAIQQGFTVTSPQGMGSIGVMFTLRPGSPGANRIPSAGQIATVASLIAGQFPGDDGIYMCPIVAYPINVVLKLTWGRNVPGWTDSRLFPNYNPSPNLVVASPIASGALTPLLFRVSSAVMADVPQVGQNIGFLDLPNLTFRRKKILTVTTIDATHYDLSVDTTTGLSDTTYTPLTGQPCCPWSDSLQSLITPVVTYFDALGPGEQFSSFFDPGLRQRRSPPSPQFWPNQITNRLLGGAIVPQAAQGPQQNQPPVSTLFTLPTLNDVQLTEPVVPFSAPVGSPGVYSNMLTLASIVAFPQP